MSWIGFLLFLLAFWLTRFQVNIAISGEIILISQAIGFVYRTYLQPYSRDVSTSVLNTGYSYSTTEEKSYQTKFCCQN